MPLNYVGNHVTTSSLGSIFDLNTRAMSSNNSAYSGFGRRMAMRALYVGRFYGRFILPLDVLGVVLYFALSKDPFHPYLLKSKAERDRIYGEYIMKERALQKESITFFRP